MKKSFKNWVTIMALTGMALITIANIQHQTTIKKLKAQTEQLATDYKQVQELEKTTRLYLTMVYQDIHHDMYNHVIEYHENGNQDYANEVDVPDTLWNTLALLGYDMTFNGLIK